MIETRRPRRRTPNAWPATGVRRTDPTPAPDRPWPGWFLLPVLVLVAVAGWLVAVLVGYGGWVLVHGARGALPWGGAP